MCNIFPLQMNNPVDYSESNCAQKIDAEELLGFYNQQLKWSDNENILDIGCGDSGTTLEVLLPKLPSNFNKLVAVDISEEMIEFARSKCHNPKIHFSIFDIASPTVPSEFQENFHHIFSFYCLNWVHDQKQALKNMFKMLRPGGQIMLCLMAHGDLFHSWLKLANIKKWAPYMTNIGNAVPVYHFSKDPKKDFEIFLRQAGFVDYTCRLVDRTCIFPDLSYFMKLMCSINIFIRNISESEVEDYREDYISCLKHHVLFDPNSGEVHLRYKMLTALASK